jgi:hypothetical protein
MQLKTVVTKTSTENSSADLEPRGYAIVAAGQGRRGFAIGST